MWVKIVDVRSTGVNGTVANDPTRAGSPPYGAEIHIPFDKIEELGSFG
jgi:hypothetical protein